MQEEKYDISGMHCAACSASVERVTRRLPGVERSDVNLTTDDKIVTLSTCLANNKPNNRYLVQGVLIKDEFTY